MPRCHHCRKDVAILNATLTPFVRICDECLAKPFIRRYYNGNMNVGPETEPLGPMPKRLGEAVSYVPPARPPSRPDLRSRASGERDDPCGDPDELPF